MELNRGAAARHAARSWGDGEPTIIFGHGLGGDQGHWRATADLLAQRHRVLTFDAAGSGDCGPAVFSAVRHSDAQGFADDLSALVSELDLRGSVYVGHSMSGNAGALASAEDPGLFSRLVLVGASARYIDDPATGYVGGMTEDGLADLLAAVRSGFSTWAAGFAPAAMANGDRPVLAEEFAQSLQRYQPDVAYTLLRGAFRSDFRAEMSRVAVPTLVLQAAEDVAVPLAAAQWLADAIPQARLELLPAAGHFPHVANPAAVAAAIEGFLSEDPRVGVGG